MKPKLIISILIAIILLLLAGGGYFYYQLQKTQATQVDPKVAAQNEMKKTVEDVGKLIDLPIGEDPTVATVTDVSKLQSQAFFAKAKNGDKVLIYTAAKKAILYDPNLKKILDVTTINIGTPSASTAPSTSPTTQKK